MVKYTEHKICHFNYFKAYNEWHQVHSQFLCNHHHYSFPELFNHPKLKLCIHLITVNSPFPPPPAHFCFYEFAYFRYVIQYLFFCVWLISPVST